VVSSSKCARIRQPLAARCLVEVCQAAATAAAVVVVMVVMVVVVVVVAAGAASSSSSMQVGEGQGSRDTYSQMQQATTTGKEETVPSDRDRAPGK